MSSNLPRVGIFGTDKITEVLVPLLRQEGFKVEALWGYTVAEAQPIADKLNIPFATNRMDDVLLCKDVELVIVLCMPSCHSEIAVKALGIGKHVTVQPPGGLTQDESLRMVQSAQYYPNLFSTLHTGLRFHPAFRKMKDAIKSGMIGPRVNVCDVRLSVHNVVGESYSWKCDSIMGGGLLQRYGSHIIDLLYYLTGQKAKRVSGNLKNFVETTENISGIRSINCDDVAVFHLENESCFSTITLNSLLHGFDQEIRISGADGYLTAKNGNLYFYSNKSKEEQTLYEEDDSQFSLNDDPLCSGIHLKGLLLLFRNLAKYFSSDESEKEIISKCLTTFNDAHYVQAVIEGVKNSSQNKKWTQVILKQQEIPDFSTSDKLHFLPARN